MSPALVPEPPDPVSAGGPRSGWVRIPPRTPDQVPLRCWWSRPLEAPPRAGVLVLPEVFGINAWVRGVADRLADRGYAALAVPLFARTAPELDLGYSGEELAEGRSHKDRTTASQLLADLSLAASWLRRSLAGTAGVPDRAADGEGRLGCVGFCFGGHVAMLAATLPEVAATADFYGAGVASGRPGGGPPTLELVPGIRGRLLCVCGSEDPLLPAADVEAIAATLARASRSRPERPHRLLRLEAGHGFMCEERDAYRPEAAAAGWQALLELFEAELG